MTKLRHYRKQLLRPGTFTGEDGRRMTFDERTVRLAAESLNRAIADGVTIPVVFGTPEHPLDLHEATPNIERDARYVGHADLAAFQDGWLLADLDVGDRTVPESLDVSVWMVPEHTVDGKTYAPFVRHILLTDEPAVSGQSQMALLRRCDDAGAVTRAARGAAKLFGFGGTPRDATVLMDTAALAAGDTAKPYGDVAYADPGYQEDKQKRYPIDTEEHIRAAWNYIHHPDSEKQYTSAQVAEIEGRVVAAWKKTIDPAGPPGADGSKLRKENEMDLITQLRTRLGVAADAAEPVVLAALDAKLKAQPAPIVEQIRLRLGLAKDATDADTLTAIEAKLKAAAEPAKPTAEPELPEEVRLRLGAAEAKLRKMDGDAFGRELDVLTSVEGRITPAVRDKVKGLFENTYGMRLRAGDGKEQSLQDVLLAIFRDLPKHHALDEHTARLRSVPGLPAGEGLTPEAVKAEQEKTRRASPALAAASK